MKNQKIRIVTVDIDYGTTVAELKEKLKIEDIFDFLDRNLDVELSLPMIKPVDYDHLSEEEWDKCREMGFEGIEKLNFDIEKSFALGSIVLVGDQYFKGYYRISRITSVTHLSKDVLEESYLER